MIEVDSCDLDAWRLTGKASERACYACGAVLMHDEYALADDSHHRTSWTAVTHYGPCGAECIGGRARPPTRDEIRGMHRLWRCGTPGCSGGVPLPEEVRHG